MTKIVSWNVNGFRAIMSKQFKESMLSLDADIICLQEVKLQKEQVPKSFLEDEYFSKFKCYWDFGARKGYSGVSIFTKEEPLSVKQGMGIEEYDLEGRIITLEFNEYYLICTYFPNTQAELVRLPYKMGFNEEFQKFMDGLKKKKNVILCGDLNVAHNEIDLKNPKANVDNPGFSMPERKWMDSLLKSGYVDVFRRQNPTLEKYTWWSYRYNSREKDVGWRIDYFVCNEEFYEKMGVTTIHKNLEGSDHCPIMLELKI